MSSFPEAEAARLKRLLWTTGLGDDFFSRQRVWTELTPDILKLFPGERLVLTRKRRVWRTTLSSCVFASSLGVSRKMKTKRAREREVDKGEGTRRERIDFFPRTVYRDFTCAFLTRDYATAAAERRGRRRCAALVPVAQPHYLRSSLRRLGN